MRLSDCDVEATLVSLVLHVTTAALAHVAQHFAEHVEQGIVAHFATSGAVGVFHHVVVDVGDVEGGAVEVA